MGWSTPAAEKRQIADALGTREKVVEMPPFDTVVVDVNASFRSQFNTFNGHLTPYRAASMYITRLKKLYPASEFVWCFDNPDRVPEVRSTFYTERRYPKATRPPKEDEVLVKGRLFKASEAPVDDEFEIVPTFMSPSGSGKYLWSKVWNNSRAKHRLWCALADSILELDDGIVDGPDGIVHRSDTTSNWGEADAKALHWSLMLPGSVCIETIDWDMYIQILLLGRENAVCHIGTVLVDGTNEYYSNRRAPKTCSKVHELLLPPVDLTRRQRIHAAFWCLAHGGVDYCLSLKMKKVTFDILINRKFMGHSFLREGFIPDQQQRVFEFREDRYSWNTCEEIRNILFCVLYYLSWNPDRCPAGPQLEDVHLGTSVEEHRTSALGLSEKIKAVFLTSDECADFG